MPRRADYTNEQLLADVKEVIKNRNLDDPIQQSIIRLTLSDKYRRADIRDAIKIIRHDTGYIPYPVGGTPPQ